MAIKPSISIKTKRRGGVNSFTIKGLPSLIEYRVGGAGGGSRWVLNKKKVNEFYKEFFRAYKKILATQMSKNRSTGNYSYKFDSTGDTMVYNAPGLEDSKYGNFLRNINHKVTFVDEGLKRGLASSAVAVIDLNSSEKYSKYIDRANPEIKHITLKKGVYPIFSRKKRKVVWYTVRSTRTIVLKNKPINSYEAFKQTQQLVNIQRAMN